VKVRAAVLEEFAQPLAVQEVELDGPGDGEVLVRLAACGVCHTDLYTASGADPSGYAPTVLGHEGAGVVEEVGEGVTSVAPGDHVVTLFSPQSGECVHCRSPKTNLCLAIRKQQNTRLSRDGERLRHFMGTSTFAEYTVIPEIALARVSPDAPLEGAALFACGLSTRPRAGAAAGRPLDRRGDRRAAVPLATSSRSTTSTAASSCSRPRTASAP
jgi:S-(hydroxymethyl)glutathione dehydrogenase/alcohol dehydrogenase